MPRFTSLSTVFDNMRRQAGDGPAGVVRDGRYDRASIMGFAVKMARRAGKWAGSWRLRMASGLRTAWAYARQQMATVGKLAAYATPTPAPASPPARPVIATARPYYGRRSGFSWGSRATTHGW